MSRIAVVIDPWDYPFNGTVVSTRRFIGALTRAGYRFQLLALPGPGIAEDEAFDQLSIPGVNGIIDAMKAPLAKPDRAKIRRLLAGCDLLHVQYPFFLAWAAIEEARSMEIPVVCSFHVQPENIQQNLHLSSATLSRLLYRLFIRYIYARASHVVAPSAFAANLLRGHGLDRPITVISNGVPDRFFALERQPFGTRQLLLSVGRLAREKQQETLLRAVARSAHRDTLEVVLAGVGPREKHLKRLAKALGINARIGWVDDDELLSLYGRADLFVHAGTIELEGMSVLEAMAAGNAVVVSDSADSACAALIHEANARFAMGDPVDLAERIDYWMANPDLRVSQGRFNRTFAQAHAHDKTSARLMSFYEEVLSEGPAEAMGPRLAGTL
ncbi:MAG: glycosyltransferase [Gammaproteobacteria bacterium]|nr:MAG: glycosyltransferase [Gammaproteobacteria bacterium]